MVWQVTAPARRRWAHRVRNINDARGSVAYLLVCACDGRCVSLNAEDMFTFLNKRCNPTLRQTRTALIASCVSLFKGLVEKSGVGKEIRVVDEEPSSLAPTPAATPAIAVAAPTQPSPAAGDSSSRSPKRKSIPDVANRSVGNGPKLPSTLGKRVAFMPPERDLDETSTLGRQNVRFFCESEIVT